MILILYNMHNVVKAIILNNFVLTIRWWSFRVSKIFRIKVLLARGFRLSTQSEVHPTSCIEVIELQCEDRSTSCLEEGREGNGINHASHKVSRML